MLVYAQFRWIWQRRYECCGERKNYGYDSSFGTGKGGSLKYALAVSLVLLGFGRMRRAPRGKLFGVLFVVLMVVGLENGCGGGSSGAGGGGGAGQPGTPTGNYTITATATSGSLTHTAQVSLTVH